MNEISGWWVPPFLQEGHTWWKKKKMRMWRVQLAEQAIRFCIVKTKDSASWEHYHNSNFSKEKGMLFWQSWGEMKWLELNNQVSYNNRTVSVVVLHFMKATSNLQWNIIYGSICCICEKKNNNFQISFLWRLYLELLHVIHLPNMFLICKGT